MPRVPRYFKAGSGNAAVRMNYSYSAFGLNIGSEIALPELMDGNGPVDVIIRLGKVDPPNEAKAKGPFFQATSDDVHLCRNGVARVLVHKGKEIVVDLDPDAKPISVRFLILSAAMASILHQRGLLVLHASAVEIDGAGIIFLGSPGSGKSTIAAAMHSRGRRVLSDEVVAVLSGEPRVLSGIPLIRLVQESAIYLGQNPDCMQRLSPGEDKMAYPAKRDFLAQGLPLKGIYVLEEDQMNQIEPLGPQEAFPEIVRNTYTAGLIEANGATGASDHLKGCASIVSKVPVKRLRRGRGLDQIQDLLDMVERDIAGMAN